MIEILFGESEAAAMKVAKNPIVIGKTDGQTSVWRGGKKKVSEKENGGGIEGTSEEVLCFNFMLDIGDIKEKIDSSYRRNLIYSMYAQGQWEKDDHMDQELQRIGDCYCNQMYRLQKYLEDGEPIRVWYSDAPYSLCGFYYLCSILQKSRSEIRVVKLPEYKVCSHFIAHYQNWGEVGSEEFAGFLSCEKTLSTEELRMYALLWGELKEDNSALRARVNGKVIGVPEYFYDFLIWKRITREPIKEARLLGEILGYNPVSVGDWWYAKRIDFLIEQGKIKVIEDSENKYARIICLA